MGWVRLQFFCVATVLNMYFIFSFVLITLTWTRVGQSICQKWAALRHWGNVVARTLFLSGYLCITKNHQRLKKHQCTALTHTVTGESYCPLCSGQSNLHPPIWGPSRQLYDQHRNTNMKNKDHQGGQLTSLKVAAPGSACCRGGRAQCKMAKRKYKEKDKKYKYRNTV